MKSVNKSLHLNKTLFSKGYALKRNAFNSNRGAYYRTVPWFMIILMSCVCILPFRSTIQLELANRFHMSLLDVIYLIKFGFQKL